MLNMSTSETVNTGETADPLKGLLRDKGAVEVERSIRSILRKMTRVQEAMLRLVDAQRASAKEAGCECMDLYFASNRLSGRAQQKHTPLSFSEMKTASVLEWRAKQTFADICRLRPASRLYPFDATHPSHLLVADYLLQLSPRYYKVLAAYETARLTLNYALKALFKIALDLHRMRVDSEQLPRELFDKATARLSEQFIRRVDTTGELEWILQGLYFEM
jgi:hypothetical protein